MARLEDEFRNILLNRTTPLETLSLSLSQSDDYEKEHLSVNFYMNLSLSGHFVQSSVVLFMGLYFIVIFFLTGLNLI